jgi:hypothetical protein
MDMAELEFGAAADRSPNRKTTPVAGLFELVTSNYSARIALGIARFVMSWDDSSGPTDSGSVLLTISKSQN